MVASILDGEAGESPKATWKSFFAAHTPSPAALNRSTEKLHRKGRHDHVVELIRAALRVGLSRPWMYEVLGISLELSGAPQAEVERALLSRVDFVAADVPNLLLSGAYLNRLGAKRPALRLYQEAAQLDPNRAETYAVSLRLAQSLDDFEVIGWAAAGLMRTAWTDRGEALRKQAKDAVLIAVEQLQEADRNEEAEQLRSQFDRAASQDLVLRLDWSGDADLDLFVEEPSGTTCSHEVPITGGGGYLGHDGYGPDSDNSYELYVCPLAFDGLYTVRIRHVRGNVVGKRAKLRIVRFRGTEQETVRVIPIELIGPETPVLVAMSAGRRTAAIESKPRRSAAAIPDTQRGSIHQLVGRLSPEQLAAGNQFQVGMNNGGVAIGGGAVGGAAFNAVGYTPITTTLSQGATLQTQAIVSADRRYVRITAAPAFTQITGVDTFSFVSGGP
ncbi:hypothetical protein [Stratiformator vulcanicus]|uniref:Tetratricopeptide repeat protein n=1 Tax=Stratiformator vulcanicus TaxID=2527980 RepID=A0A517R2D1_9PLAN|nr:hypothetical protein [Stratiformator vulcanicus]QDT38036.1 hypothetical protein Pan189_24210 [Stratiformator vulcanicus]